MRGDEPPAAADIWARLREAGLGLLALLAIGRKVVQAVQQRRRGSRREGPSEPELTEDEARERWAGERDRRRVGAARMLETIERNRLAEPLEWQEAAERRYRQVLADFERDLQELRLQVGRVMDTMRGHADAIELLTKFNGQMQVLLDKYSPDRLTDQIVGGVAAAWTAFKQQHVGMRVLIVEDNTETALALEELTEAHGHTTRSATDGAHALDVIERDRRGFDLILVDLMMPVMKGDEMIRKLRATGYAGFIVLISGAEIEPVLRQAGAQAGADRVHTKPINDAVLEDILAEAWRRSPSRHDAARA